jgi:hypothetical protein
VPDARITTPVVALTRRDAYRSGAMVALLAELSAA